MNGWQSLGFKTYQEYLDSNLWKEKRQWILQVRGNTCERCGSTRSIQVHHISYDSVGNEKQADVMVLCKKCHQKEENNGANRPN